MLYSNLGAALHRATVVPAGVTQQSALVAAVLLAPEEAHYAGQLQETLKGLTGATVLLNLLDKLGGSIGAERRAAMTAGAAQLLLEAGSATDALDLARRAEAAQPNVRRRC